MIGSTLSWSVGAVILAVAAFVFLVILYHNLHVWQVPWCLK